MTFRLAAVAALALLPLALAGADPRSEPSEEDQRHRRLAHLPWRLFGQALQHARSDQSVQRRHTHAAWAFKALATADSATNVGGPWKPGDPTYWGGPTDYLPHCGIAADGGRHDVHLRHGPRLGHQCAHRRAEMELFFQDPRRPSQQRQQRHGHVRRWLYFETPGLLPGVSGCGYRQGAVVSSNSRR